MSRQSEFEAAAYDERRRLEWKNQGMNRLVTAVQELSLARDLNAVMSVVRKAARDLTGADGATFVLRDGGACYYVDEDAIAPLWKGQRFPLDSCISGWTMLQREPAVIEDIYNDPRIPVDVYRKTFVKSLAMVPIRTEAPIGAIGNYWARQHRPEPGEIELLQALANTTSVAMENVRVYQELEWRVRLRTAELQTLNGELDSFSHAVSHDLRAPLRSIDAFAGRILRRHGPTLHPEIRESLEHIQARIALMRGLIEDLLRLSKVSRCDLRTRIVDLGALAREIVARLAAAAPERIVEVTIPASVEAEGDPGLLGVVLENLLGNAWKYTGKRREGRIQFSLTRLASGGTAYCISDNGAGFDMQHAQKLFQPFQRLHTAEEFSGSGIGLSTVRRIISRHGGRVWCEAEPDKGARFFFTLWDNPEAAFSSQSSS